MNHDASKRIELPPGSETLPESVRPVMLALWEQNRALSGRVYCLEEQLKQTRKSALTWEWITHPYVPLALSIAVALAFAALVVLYRELARGGDRYTFFLIYIVPISAPFIAFLLDRAAHWREYAPLQFLIDGPLVILSLARALYDVPLISGHALFLTYALLTVKSRAVQVLTAIVLLEVIYLKAFAWHDATLIGGAILGILAAIAARRYGRKGLAVS